MRQVLFFALPLGLALAGELGPEGIKAMQKDIKVQREFTPINYCLNPLDYGWRVQNLNPDSPLVVRVLVLRVEFQKEDPDDPETTGDGKFIMVSQGTEGELTYDPPHDRVYFERMMEMAQKYFGEETMGGVRVEYIVKPDAKDSAYQLPHKMRYYGDWDFWAQGIVVLIKDAIEAADLDPSVDFNDLDCNGTPDYMEGVLPLVMLFHAGSPYQTDVMYDTPFDIPALTAFAGAFYYYFGSPYLLANNGTDTIWSCTVMPEEMTQDGWRIRLQATLVHEMTHLIWQIPDLYDIYYKGIGVGAWDIQGSAPYLEDKERGIPPGLYPVLHSGWSRLDWMNWYFKNYVFGRGFIGDSIWSEIIPKSQDTTITVYPACARTGSLDTVGHEGTPRFVKVKLNKREYYMVENRLRDLNGDGTVLPLWKDGVVIGPQYGEWDFLLPGEGLLVWHVDQAIIESTDYYEMNAVRPMGLDLEEADHVQDLEYWGSYPEDWFGSPRDPYYQGNNTELGPYTTPDTRANRGGHTGVFIHGVSAQGRPMRFQVRNDLVAWRRAAGGPEERTPMTLLADLDGDGGQEVLVARVGRVDTVGTWAKFIANIYAFRGDGTPYFGNSDGFFSSVRDSLDTLYYYQDDRLIQSVPAAGDLDGDGIAEVVFGTAGGKLYAFSAKDDIAPGKADPFPGFPISLGTQMRTSPSVADLDRDGRDEILFGHDGNWFACLRWNPSQAKMDTVFQLRPGGAIRTAPGLIGDTIVLVSGDNMLHLFDSAGHELSGFPKGDPSPFPNYGWPGIGDIDSDGETEVIYFSNQGDGTGYITCIDMRGNKKWEREADKPIMTPIALGDLEGDGLLEAAWVSGGRLWCVNSNGALVSGYPIALPYIQRDSLRGYSAPIFAEGKLLIVISRMGVFAYDAKGKLATGFPFELEGNAPQAPALGNIVGDRALEMIIADSLGNLVAWRIPDTIRIWPQIGHDERHTSCMSQNPYGFIASGRKALDRVYFYPNPARKRIWLRFYVPEAGELLCEIFTFGGERVLSRRWQVSGGAMEEREIDVSGLGPDVYMARVVFGKETKIVKFAVERGPGP
ncbi:MAG: FG-GAP-like repeat-containing protein [candidate division WOR-3 bacterium]